MTGLGEKEKDQRKIHTKTEPSARPEANQALKVNMDNDWKYLHGRLDPGNDATAKIVEFIPPKELPPDEVYHGKKMLDDSGSSSARNIKSIPVRKAVTGMQDFLTPRLKFCCFLSFMCPPLTLRAMVQRYICVL